MICNKYAALHLSGLSLLNSHDRSGISPWGKHDKSAVWQDRRESAAGSCPSCFEAICGWVSAFFSEHMEECITGTLLKCTRGDVW